MEDCEKEFRISLEKLRSKMDELTVHPSSPLTIKSIEDFDVHKSTPPKNVTDQHKKYGTSQQILKQKTTLSRTATTVKKSVNKPSSSSSAQMVTKSSRRYKSDINDVNEQDVESCVEGLRPRTFCYNEAPSQQLFGLVAEEVEDVLPQAVVTKNGQPEAIRYDVIVAILLSAIQLERQRVATIETTMNDRMTTIENKISKHRAKMEEVDVNLRKLSNGIVVLGKHLDDILRTVTDTFDKHDRYIDKKLREMWNK